MSETTKPQVRPFAAVLAEVGSGTFAARLAEQLQEIVSAVTDTGRKGVLTVQLTVAPLKAGNTRNLIVTGRSSAKVPEADEAAPTTVFFPDAHGNLSRNDPNQPTLPLRGLEAPQKESA